MNRPAKSRSDHATFLVSYFPVGRARGPWGYNYISACVYPERATLLRNHCGRAALLPSHREIP